MTLSAYTVNDVLRNNYSPKFEPLPAPPYKPPERLGPRLGMAVESMKYHTTDEGWQLFAGLEGAGYELAGWGLSTSHPDGGSRSSLVEVREILNYFDHSVGARTPHPLSTIVVQDKREWEVAPRDFREQLARFRGIAVLKDRSDIFKLTVLKDAHQRPGYHADAAAEMGCHAWVVYYHPRIVKHLAPYVRIEHLVRVYHTVDSSIVPVYSEDDRGGVLLSGAVSGAYPLRQRLVAEWKRLPETIVLPHPGYHRNGCATPSFLQTLSRYKVAICTSSVFGYALRKVIEATACGCRVLTDLPTDEVLPFIDGNLVRINPHTSTSRVAEILDDMLRTYNPETQKALAIEACRYYDYRTAGRRLASQIDGLRRNYV